MNTISPEEFGRIKKKIKILDRLNKLLAGCLVVACVNLILLFFGINLIDWGKNAALAAAEKWGPLFESTFNELSEILGERAAS